MLMGIYIPRRHYGTSWGTRTVAHSFDMQSERDIDFAP